MTQMEVTLSKIIDVVESIIAPGTGVVIISCPPPEQGAKDTMRIIAATNIGKNAVRLAQEFVSAAPTTGTTIETVQ